MRRRVDLQAHNEKCRALGKAENQLIPLSWQQRTFGYVFTFGGSGLVKDFVSARYFEAVHANLRDVSSVRRFKYLLNYRVAHAAVGPDLV
jgi:hypothetical protein